MIKFALFCDSEHAFEAWFGSGEDYDTQKKNNLVTCPVCGTDKVEKALMAPGVSSIRKLTDTKVPVAQMLMPQLPLEMKKQLRAFKKQIEAHAENMGERFPEEARKIHYGEAEARGIYGRATLEEAAGLAEEGIEVMPIPELPEDKN